jgi:outer membrane protein TolC
MPPQLLFALGASLVMAVAQTVANASGLPEPLTLEQALVLADDPHPSLDKAGGVLDEARAERQRVDALDNVKVDLELAARVIEPSYRAKPVDPSNNDSWAKLRMHKRLYDFGRTDHLNDAAEAQLRGGELGLLSARQQRRLVVMSRFFDVLLADLEQARDNEAMAIAYVRMDRARNRSELGQVSDVTLLELESRYQALLTRQRTSQARQRATRSRLAMALNRPDDLPANLVFPDLAAIDREAEDVDLLVEEALANNPGLRALRAEVTAAERRVEAALAGYGAVIRGELEGAAYNRSMGRDNPFTAALVLDVPLSSGGAREAEAARQRALRRQRQADLAERELEVRQAVLEAWLDLDTLQARRREITVEADFRELDLDRSRSLYELEFTSDLGDAMTRTSEVRLAAAQNDFDIALTWARLDALTGRLIGAASNPQQFPGGATGSESR